MGRRAGGVPSATPKARGLAAAGRGPRRQPGRANGAAELDRSYPYEARAESRSWIPQPRSHTQEELIGKAPKTRSSRSIEHGDRWRRPVGPSAPLPSDDGWLPCARSGAKVARAGGPCLGPQRHRVSRGVCSSHNQPEGGQSWHMADRLRPPRARMGRVREAMLAMASIQVWVGRHACNLTR